MSYVILTKPGCHVCARTRALLKSHKEPFAVSEHDTPAKIARFEELGYPSFPQVFHKGVRIGGYADLIDHLGE